jgi:hypothetical protein
MSQPGHGSASYAVIGFVSDEAARSVGSGKYGKALEVRTQRGSDHEVVRIPADHIAGVLHGASQEGETSVQVILKEDAKVETLSHGVASDLHLRPISDPSTILHRPPIFVIYIDPHLHGLSGILNQLSRAKE